MSIYKGDTLISGKGTIVVDDRLSETSSNPVKNMVVADAINKVNKPVVPTTNTYVETVDSNDTDGKNVYSEYVKKNGNDNIIKLFRVFTPDGSKYCDFQFVITNTTAAVSISSSLKTAFAINGKTVYCVGSEPYVVKSFTATVGTNTVTLGLVPKFVIYNDGGTAKIGTVTSNGFTANLTNAGTCNYIAFV